MNRRARIAVARWLRAHPPRSVADVLRRLYVPVTLDMFEAEASHVPRLRLSEADRAREMGHAFALVTGRAWLTDCNVREEMRRTAQVQRAWRDFP